jgi:HlyD family secretion protein
VYEDGESARRTAIRLGRQNPRFVEILEGLRPGDRIVTSSYEAFNEVDELVFTEPAAQPAQLASRTWGDTVEKGLP